MRGTRHRVTFDYDPDPDFSWLEQDCYNPDHPTYEPVYLTAAGMRAKRNTIDGQWYRDPDNHVALTMLVEQIGPKDDDWTVIDSLCGIDFLKNADDYTIGTFYRYAAIPKRCRYLRLLARGAGMHDPRPRRKR